MPSGGIRPERQTGSKAVRDVAPMIGRRIARIDAFGFDGIDRIEKLADPPTTVDAKERFGARTDEGKRLTGCPGGAGAKNLDTEMDGAEIVRRPAHEREDRAGTERQNAGARADDALGGDAPEADPLRAAAIDCGEFDLGERRNGRRGARGARDVGSRERIVIVAVAAHQRRTGRAG